MKNLIVVVATCLLAACSSPPKPPVVNGAHVAINSDDTNNALQLQAVHAAAKQQLSESSPKSTEIEAIQVSGQSTKSALFTFYFPDNSIKMEPPSQAQELVLLPLLVNARRVEVRGRTDAEHPSAKSENIAFLRAQAARNYLLDRGVSGNKIAINFLSGGDPVASNETAAGRSKNRRVEIEVFN